jgi:hypothetical protein
MFPDAHHNLLCIPYRYQTSLPIYTLEIQPSPCFISSSSRFILDPYHPRLSSWAFLDPHYFLKHARSFNRWPWASHGANQFEGSFSTDLIQALQLKGPSRHRWYTRSANLENFIWVSGQPVYSLSLFFYITQTPALSPLWPPLTNICLRWTSMSPSNSPQLFAVGS